jgi:hypothetical protein
MKRGSVQGGRSRAQVVMWLDAEARLADRVVRLGEKREDALKHGSTADAADALRRLRYLEFLHEVLEYEEAA